MHAVINGSFDHSTEMPSAIEAARQREKSVALSRLYKERTHFAIIELAYTIKSKMLGLLTPEHTSMGDLHLPTMNRGATQLALPGSISNCRNYVCID